MTKKIIGFLMATMMLLTVAPAAFAGSAVGTSEVPVEDESLIYPQPPFYGNINIDVSVNSALKPSAIVMNPDYNVTADSREDALKKINAAYDELKSKVEKYATVSKTSSSVYPGYNYLPDGKSEETFNGYLNASVRLTDLSAYETVKDLIMTAGFNVGWTDAQVDEEDKIDLEYALVKQLKSQINKRKSVYEEILGYHLTRATSLYINTWPDGSQYDPSTGMVKVTVNASIGYEYTDTGANK